MRTLHWSIVVLLFSAAAARGDAAEREKKIEAAVAKAAAKAGSDQTLRIDITGMDDVDRVFHGFFERLMHAAQGKVHREGAHWQNPNQMFLALAPVADVQSYAKRLSLPSDAKITIDAATRRISIALPADAKVESLWTEAKSPEGDWSVLALGAMKAAEKGPAGQVKQNVHESGEIQFFVAVGELPAAKLKWNEHLANAVAALKTQGLTIVSEKDVREKGIGQGGKEVVTKNADGAMTIWRVYASIHNKRVYRIGVAGDESAIASYDAEHYLTSFKIVKRP